MIDYLEQTVRDFEGQIEVVITPFRSAVANLVTIPGISATAAHVIIAEIGVDMSRFATVAHLRSWAGLCPQLNESAGKIISRRLRPVHRGSKLCWCSAPGRQPATSTTISTLNSSGSGPGAAHKMPLSRWPPQSFPSPIICCAIKCRIAISEHSISHAPIRSEPRSASRAESKSSATKSKFAKQPKCVSFLEEKIERGR
jgi:hypothetical protein